MKRVQENTDFFIQCHCGEKFVANTLDSELNVSYLDGTHREWCCPKCGQDYQEPIKGKILLDAITN